MVPGRYATSTPGYPLSSLRLEICLHAFTEWDDVKGWHETRFGSGLGMSGTWYVVCSLILFAGLPDSGFERLFALARPQTVGKFGVHVL